MMRMWSFFLSITRAADSSWPIWIGWCHSSSPSSTPVVHHCVHLKIFINSKRLHNFCFSFGPTKNGLPCHRINGKRHIKGTLLASTSYFLAYWINIEYYWLSDHLIISIGQPNVGYLWSAYPKAYWLSDDHLIISIGQPASQLSGASMLLQQVKPEEKI